MGFYSKIPYSYKEDECLVIVLIEIYNLVKTKNLHKLSHHFKYLCPIYHQTRLKNLVKRGKQVS